ncbi:hypothetical protein B296_00005741 [Ensete ventricosum]|uniref:Uncharacterized protein n=1 Tax=Ensete ventricosum TaxID=4639 RepID=A0A426Z152_ENSVE|nr:hypothetical protein B296_00005741 [Ensete ventricosum]
MVTHRMRSTRCHDELSHFLGEAEGQRALGDSVIVAVIPLSNVPGDSKTTDALVAMRFFFNVDSTVITR